MKLQWINASKMKTRLVVIVTTFWLTVCVAGESLTARAPTKPPVYKNQWFEVRCLVLPHNRFYYEGTIKTMTPTGSFNNALNNNFVLQKKLQNVERGEWKNEKCNLTFEASHLWRFKCLLSAPDGRSFNLRLVNTKNNTIHYITQHAIREDDLWQCIFKPKSIELTPYDNRVEMHLVMGSLLEQLGQKISANIDSQVPPQNAVLYEIGTLRNRILHTFNALEECTEYNVSVIADGVVEAVYRKTRSFVYRVPIKTLCPEIPTAPPPTGKDTEIILTSTGAIFVLVIVVLLFRYTRKKIRVMKENILGPREQTELIVPITATEESIYSSTYEKVNNESDHSHNYDFIGNHLLNGDTSPRTPNTTEDDEPSCENNYDTCDLGKVRIT